ncbi:MAG: thioredoxin family protein [Synergistaceae bacterium]|jgi:hypothetical protein|nr:thioredoxin family protein [Synergistaceae bacterium]
MRIFHLSLLLAISIILCAAVSSSAGLSIPEPASVDISEAMSFEKYLTTGSSGETEKLLNRMDNLDMAESLKSSALEGNERLTLVVFGWMSCPDCEVVIPYIESVRRLNPNISTLYFGRNDATKAVLRNLAGASGTPAVFAARQDGTLLGPYYHEYPQSVRARLNSARDNDEKRDVIRDFRSGKYETELQQELAGMLKDAWRSIAAD